MLEAAGHAVIRYEKHNDEIGLEKGEKNAEKTLSRALSQTLSTPEEATEDKREKSVERSSETPPETQISNHKSQITNQKPPISNLESQISNPQKSCQSCNPVQKNIPSDTQAPATTPQPVAQPHSAEPPQPQISSFKFQVSNPQKSCQSCNPVPKKPNPFRAFSCFSWLRKHPATSSPAAPWGEGTPCRATHAPETKPGSGAEPQRKLLSTLYALRSKFQLFAKTIWNQKTYREITALIRERRPDVVHCHNTFPLVSPSVYWAAARQGVPVVQTLHNYRLVCINPYLYRNDRICEDCLGRSPVRGVIRRCYRDSFAASFTVAAMLTIHRLLGTYRNKITTYIALTEFGRQKFLDARLCAPEKVVVKPNVVGVVTPTAERGEKREERSAGRGSAPDPGSELASEKTLSRALSQTLSTPEERPAPQEPTTKSQTPPPPSESCQSCNPVQKNTPSDTQAPATTPQPVAHPHSAEPPQPQISNFTSQISNSQKSCQSCNPVQKNATSDTQAPATTPQPVAQPHSAESPQPQISNFKFQISPPTLLYVGRLSPEKGVDILITAWKLLLARQQAPAANHKPLAASYRQSSRQSCPSETLAASRQPPAASYRQSSRQSSRQSCPSETLAASRQPPAASYRQSSRQSSRQSCPSETLAASRQPPAASYRQSSRQNSRQSCPSETLAASRQPPAASYRQSSRQSSRQSCPSETLAASRQPLAAKLHIIGDGPERTALEAMAQDLPSVTFLGRLSQADLHAQMAAASVIVQPSTCYETFALAVNEAATLGTPAIVSDIGGQASVVEDGATGFVFRSGSAESLADTLAKALADPDRLAEMGRHAQARFLAGDCPPEQNILALEKIYRDSFA
ncbi:MAG: glycosyltransferase [Kiritimatiellia bacterium]